MLLPQEPRHLQLLADLEDSNIFSLIAGKKLYNAPAEYGFCIKVNPHWALPKFQTVLVAQSHPNPQLNGICM